MRSPKAWPAGFRAVATDVGDAAAIVGDAGLIVPVRDPPALAAALATLAKEPATVRAERGKRARAHIVETFAMAGAVARFAGLYASLGQPANPVGVNPVR